MSTALGVVLTWVCLPLLEKPSRPPTPSPAQRTPGLGNLNLVMNKGQWVLTPLTNQIK